MKVLVLKTENPASFIPDLPENYKLYYTIKTIESASYLHLSCYIPDWMYTPHIRLLDIYLGKDLKPAELEKKSMEQLIEFSSKFQSVNKGEWQIY